MLEEWKYNVISFERQRKGNKRQRIDSLGKGTHVMGVWGGRPPWNLTFDRDRETFFFLLYGEWEACVRFGLSKMCVFFSDLYPREMLVFGPSSNNAKEREHNIILQTKQPTFSKKNKVKTCLLSNISQKMYINNPNSMHHSSFIQKTT